MTTILNCPQCGSYLSNHRSEGKVLTLFTCNKCDFFTYLRKENDTEPKTYWMSS